MRRNLAFRVATIAGLVGRFAPDAGAQQPDPAPTRIVRCYSAADAPCAVVGVQLDAREARREPNDSTGRWWTGRLAGADLTGVRERVDNANSAPWKLLILLDLSGSMRGEGLRYARTGLRAFINGLPPRGVAIAVAPFESRQVAARIANVRFGSPSAAVQALDALPQPDVVANTALYSAAVAGLERLDTEIRGAEPGTRGGLLLLTDGKNDVRGRADDPGLLSGATGRRTAADAAAKSAHAIWLVGAGNVDREELATLAGDRGEALVDALDAVVLANRFAHIGRQIAADREVTLRVVSPSVALLSRSGGVGTLMASTGGSTRGDVAVVRQLDWRPPLLSLPAYDGVADSATVPPDPSTAAGVEDDWNRRIVVSIALVLLWLALTASLPSLFPAPIRAASVEGQVEARETIRQSNAVAASSRDERSTGLRTDVKEAAPRKPDEITASGARRVSTAT